MLSVKGCVPRIRVQLQKLRELARVPEERLLRTVPSISGWSAAEHLDHIGKVTRSIVARVNAPEVVPGSITTTGRLVLLFGWIPRGRGKAPERLRGARASREELLAAFDEIETLLGQVDLEKLVRSREKVVPHPRFGGLTAGEAMQFAVVHIDHHLKIIRDLRAE